MSPGAVGPMEPSAADRAAQQERDRITAANCGYAYSRTVDPRYCQKNVTPGGQHPDDSTSRIATAYPDRPSSGPTAQSSSVSTISGGSQTGTPSTPSGTSPGSLTQSNRPALGNDFTMRWNGDPSASYYEFGIRDLNGGSLTVDTQVTGTSYSARLSPGSYR
jgi:hypothetical protein